MAHDFAPFLFCIFLSPFRKCKRTPLLHYPPRAVRATVPASYVHRCSSGVAMPRALKRHVGEEGHTALLTAMRPKICFCFLISRAVLACLSPTHRGSQTLHGQGLGCREGQDIAHELYFIIPFSDGDLTPNQGPRSHFVSSSFIVHRWCSRVLHHYKGLLCWNEYFSSALPLLQQLE